MHPRGTANSTRADVREQGAAAQTRTFHHQYAICIVGGGVRWHRRLLARINRGP